MTIAEILALAEGATSSAEPRQSVVEILHLLRRNLDRIDVVAHPLGFLHFELTPLANPLPGLRLRMHIWDKSSAESIDILGLLHDHIWELRSLVLWGIIEDTQYSVDYQPDGTSKETQVCYLNGIERHTSSRMAKLTPEIKMKIQAGSRYEVSAGIVHSTKILEIPTVSLVLTVPTTRDTARIFASRDLQADGHSIRPVLDVETARSRIDVVIDEICREGIN